MKAHVWIVLLVLGSLNGCQELDTSDKNDCVADGDCLNGYLCIDSVCQKGECREDGDCGTDEKCASNQCVEATDCTTNQDCSEPQPVCDDVDFTCVECTNDDHCQRGSICEGRTCVAGCRSVRDCPSGWFCKPESGPHGTCVECLQDSDCDAGSKCKNDECVIHCQSDAQCPGGEHCETESGECVDCLNSDHCEIEFLCANLECVPGCQSDRDCQPGKVCDADSGDHGACVACLLDTDCPSGYACNLPDNTCVKHCGNDDDCFPEKCNTSSGLCVECTANAHCQLATVCANFECVYGCETSQDCPDGKLCDPDYGDHGGCGECILDTDCPDEESCVNLSCTSDCSQFQCPPEKPNCNPENNACVECYHPSHCEDGFTCVVVGGFCVEGEAGSCVSSDECAEDERCAETETGMSYPCFSGQIPCDCLTTCSDEEPCLDDTTYCNFSVNGVCIPNWEVCNDETDCRGSRSICHERECVECVDNLDCADEEEHICVEGTCVLGCRTDLDCTGDEHCDTESGDHGRCFECVIDDHCPGEFATCDTRYHTCNWCTEDAHCAEEEQCNTYTNDCQPDTYGPPCQNDYDCYGNYLCADINGEEDYCYYPDWPCNCRWVCEDESDCNPDNPVCVEVVGPNVCVPE